MISSPEAQQFRAEVLALQTNATVRKHSPISQQIEQSIYQLEDSLINHVQSNSNDPRTFLLEIYANQNSPLTEAVQRLGYKAVRFTKEDGDLATFSGRQKLWGLIEKLQPEHIWMAPECGPWSGWNRLNMGKSSFMFDSISQKQEMQMPHVHLCRRICAYQVRMGRHFHLEQPAGSSLIQLDAFAFVRQHTVAARFDMCRFGLRIPKTNRFLRKKSQVLTTSRQLFHELNGILCANQHPHQRIEGSVSINGQRQILTSFCATYCQGFAKMVAGKLCKLYHTMVGADEHAMVFDDENEERPKKRFRTTGRESRKRKSSPIDSEPIVADDKLDNLPVGECETSDHPQRDPNPDVSRPEVPPAACSSSERWQAVFEEAQTFAPRVGNTRCPADSTAWSRAQSILETSMKITDMFVCRGTERFQVPLQAPASHQFPLRYTVCLHRETSAIHDLGLENWHESARAQRIRKCVPCKLTITMFGCSPEIESAPAREVVDDAEKPLVLSEPPTAVRASGSQGLPVAVHERTCNIPC
jgi:hypothetical protein